MTDKEDTCMCVKGITGAGYRCGNPAAYVWNCGSREGPLRVCADCRTRILSNTQVAEQIKGPENFEPIDPVDR